MTVRFGPYEVLEEVGTGSSGRVYKARHPELDRLAAIKVLSEQVRAVPGQRERLRAEATTLAELAHPNIVALYDYVEEPPEGQHAGRDWLAEQWVDGATLAEVVAQNNRMSPEQALGAVHGAMSGLAYAHDRGIVHRDISSGNILVDLSGTSMLVDFGLAAPAGTGSAVGTPAFLSPEAAAGQQVDKPSDVYSAAAVLYLLLTGEPVFTGDVVEQVRAHLEKQPPALASHGAELADLMSRSLAKNPTERPPDAAAFLRELEEAATRRYGPAWLERASIAGLVTGAAGVAATTGGGAASAPPAVAGVAQQAVKVTRSGRRGIAIAAGAAALIVAATAGVVVAVSGDDGGDGSSESSGPTPGSDSDTPDSEPTVDPVVASVPQGKWRLVVAYTSHSIFDNLGKAQRRRWTLEPRCSEAESCRGTLQSSSGSTFEYTWDGTSMVIKRDALPNNYLLDCVDADTQELVSRKSIRVEGREGRVLRLRQAGANRFVARTVEKGTVTPSPACPNYVGDRKYTAEKTYTLTR